MLHFFYLLNSQLWNRFKLETCSYIKDEHKTYVCTIPAGKRMDCIFMISPLKWNWWLLEWAVFSMWRNSLSPPRLCFFSLWPEDSCTPRTILFTILSSELCESISTTYFSFSKFCNSIPLLHKWCISQFPSFQTSMPLILQPFSPGILLL